MVRVYKNAKNFPLFGFLIRAMFYNILAKRRFVLFSLVVELFTCGHSSAVKLRNTGHSRVSEDEYFRKLAAFVFQAAGKPPINFYYTSFNFPKKILRKNVEKFGNAMRTWVCCSYPQSVNI